MNDGEFLKIWSTSRYVFIFLDVHKIVSTIEGVEVPISTNFVGRDTGRGRGGV